MRKKCLKEGQGGERRRVAVAGEHTVGGKAHAQAGRWWQGRKGATGGVYRWVV